MVSIGDVRKRLEQSFAEITAVLVPLSEKSADVEDVRKDVLARLDRYKEMLLEIRALVQANPELRVGNVLNALMEGEALLSEEGKGLLPDLQKVLAQSDQSADVVLQVASALRQKHETMAKFLEAEVRQDMQKASAEERKL